MSFNIFEKQLSSAESEKIVKSYHCTSLISKILRLKAEGYLNITNKRVIFFALGSSFAGPSIFDSELPIEDVSGISTYKGYYFSLKHLIGVIISSFFFSFLVESIFGYLIYRIFEENQYSKGPQIIFWILAFLSFFISLLIKKDNIWKANLSATCTLFFLSVGGIGIAEELLANFFQGVSIDKFKWGLIFGSISFVYHCLCLFWYSCRETISLFIGSKGGTSTPIAISGIAGIGLRDTTALKALTAEPAKDAEEMIREIGAIILDIQTLGEMGIQKWSN